MLWTYRLEPTGLRYNLQPILRRYIVFVFVFVNDFEYRINTLHMRYIVFLLVFDFKCNVFMASNPFLPSPADCWCNHIRNYSVHEYICAHKTYC